MLDKKVLFPKASYFKILHCIIRRSVSFNSRSHVSFTSLVRSFLFNLSYVATSLVSSLWVKKPMQTFFEIFLVLEQGQEKRNWLACIRNLMKIDEVKCV
jgi:hypothetical protein